MKSTHEQAAEPNTIPSSQAGEQYNYDFNHMRRIEALEVAGLKQTSDPLFENCGFRLSNRAESAQSLANADLYFPDPGIVFGFTNPILFCLSRKIYPSFSIRGHAKGVDHVNGITPQDYFNLVNSYGGQGVRVAILDGQFSPANIKPYCKKYISFGDCAVDPAPNNATHGTRVAAIINGYSGSVANCCELYLCTIQKNGDTSLRLLALGIIWAVLNKCHLINVSVHFDRQINDAPDETLQFLVNWSHNSSLVVCATIAEDALPYVQSALAVCNNVIRVNGLREDGTLTKQHFGNDAHAKIHEYVARAYNIITVGRFDQLETNETNLFNDISAATPLVTAALALHLAKRKDSNVLAMIADVERICSTVNSKLYVCAPN